MRRVHERLVLRLRSLSDSETGPRAAILKVCTPRTLDQKRVTRKHLRPLQNKTDAACCMAGCCPHLESPKTKAYSIAIFNQDVCPIDRV